MFCTALVLLTLGVSADWLPAQATEGEPFVVSDVVGNVIDVEERNRYGLFPEIEGSHSAAFFRIREGSYLVKITCRDVRG